MVTDEYIALVNRFINQHGVLGLITINPNGLVDVQGSVFINDDIGGNEIPILFGDVGGAFQVSNNNLHSLRGFPHRVRASLMLSKNVITSLEGLPKHVGWSGNLEDNDIVCSTENFELLSAVKFVSHLTLSGGFKIAYERYKTIKDIMS